MSQFVDRMLLQLSDPARLLDLLSPADEPDHARLRALFAAAYELPFVTIHEVREREVRQLTLQRPVLPAKRTTGTWTQTVPSFTRTDVVYERPEALSPVWIDVAAEVGLTLVLQVETSELEALLVRDLSRFATLEEFRERFRFIDLDAFMAEHRITTVEELRDAFHYLQAEIRLRAPAAFDPNDPANQHRYRLNLAVFIRDTVDLAAALREAKLALSTAEAAVVYHRQVDEGEARAPFAPVIIFPADELGSAGFTAEEVAAVFARERILALFVTPA